MFYYVLLLYYLHMNPTDHSTSSISPPHKLVLSAIKLYLAKDKHTYLVTHITHNI